MILKSPRYGKLLNLRSGTIYSYVIAWDAQRLEQSRTFLVALRTREGEDVTFCWCLSLQHHGAVCGCWMTDRVLFVREGFLAMALREKDKEINKVMQI